MVQTGVTPEHVELSTHWTHAPEDEQAARRPSDNPAHWLEVLQPTHDLLEHRGVAPPQLELVRHWAQALVLVSQTPVGSPQSVFEVHCTHRPVAAHAARRGSLSTAHWAADVQPVQTLFVQMGVVPAHWLLVRHCTQLLVVGSQTGVAPLQSLLAVHCTHAPAVEQAARSGSCNPAHWLAAVQAVQTLLAQMGALPPQLALARH